MVGEIHPEEQEQAPEEPQEEAPEEAVEQGQEQPQEEQVIEKHKRRKNKVSRNSDE